MYRGSVEVVASIAKRPAHVEASRSLNPKP